MKDQQSCDRSKALWSTLELPVCSQYLDLQNRFYNNTKTDLFTFFTFRGLGRSSQYPILFLNGYSMGSLSFVSKWLQRQMAR